MLDKFLERVRNLLPDRSETIAILGAFALGVILTAKGISCRPVHDNPDPASPPSDASLVQLGKSYTVNLGKVYASAWETGATALEAGRPVSAAIDAVRDSWERDRVALFNRFVSVEFDKVVGQRKTDAEVTAADRAALARAWRAFAAGLRK